MSAPLRRSTRSRSRLSSHTTDGQVSEDTFSDASSSIHDSSHDRRRAVDQNMAFTSKKARKTTTSKQATVNEARKSKRNDTPGSVKARKIGAVNRAIKGGARRQRQATESDTNDDENKEDGDETIYALPLTGLAVRETSTQLEDGTPRAAGPSNKGETTMKDLEEQAKKGLNMLLRKRELNLKSGEQKMLEDFRQNLRQGGYITEDASQDSQFSSSFPSFPQDSHPSSRASRLINLFTMLSALFVDRQTQDPVQTLITLTMLNQGFLNLLSGEMVSEDLLETWLATKRQLVIYSELCGQTADLKQIFGLDKGLEEILLRDGQGALLRRYEGSLQTSRKEFLNVDKDLATLVANYPFDTFLGMMTELAGPVYRSLTETSSSKSISPPPSSSASTSRQSQSPIRQLARASPARASASTTAQMSANKRTATSPVGRQITPSQDVPGVSDSETDNNEGPSQESLQSSIRSQRISKRHKSLGGTSAGGTTPTIPKVQDVREKLETLSNTLGSASPKRRRQTMPNITATKRRATKRRAVLREDEENDVEEGNSTMEVEELLTGSNRGIRTQQVAEGEDGAASTEKEMTSDAEAEVEEPGIDSALAGEDGLGDVFGDTMVRQESEESQSELEDRGIGNTEEIVGGTESENEAAEDEEDEAESDIDKTLVATRRVTDEGEVVEESTASESEYEIETQFESFPIDQALQDPSFLQTLNQQRGSFARQQKEESSEEEEEEAFVVVASRASQEPRRTSKSATPAGSAAEKGQQRQILRFNTENRLMLAEGNAASKKGKYSSLLDRQENAERIEMDTPPGSGHRTSRISQSQDVNDTPRPSTSSNKMARKSSSGRKALATTSAIVKASQGTAPAATMSEKAKGKQRAISQAAPPAKSRSAMKSGRPPPSASPDKAASVTPGTPEQSSSRPSRGASPNAAQAHFTLGNDDNAPWPEYMIDHGNDGILEYEPPLDQQDPGLATGSSNILQAGSQPSARQENGDINRRKQQAVSSGRPSKQQRVLGDDELEEAVAGSSSRVPLGSSKAVKKKKQPPASFAPPRRKSNEYLDSDSDEDQEENEDEQEMAPSRPRHSAPVASTSQRSKPVSQQNQKSKDPERAAPRSEAVEPAASAPQRLQNNGRLAQRRRVPSQDEEMEDEEEPAEGQDYDDDEEDNEDEARGGDDEINGRRGSHNSNRRSVDPTQGGTQASTSKSQRRQSDNRPPPNQQRRRSVRGDDESDDEGPQHTAGSTLHQKKSKGSKRKRKQAALGDDESDTHPDSEEERERQSQTKHHKNMTQDDKHRYLERKYAPARQHAPAGPARGKGNKQEYYYPQEHEGTIQWNDEEEICLLRCLELNPGISDMGVKKLHGKNGTLSHKLKLRNNQAIKDHKRVIVKWRRNNGYPDLEWYETWILNERKDNYIKGKRQRRQREARPEQREARGDDDMSDESD